MFVDLSGKAKPGVRVRVPLWVTRLTVPVSLTVRGELNGSTSDRDTDTITATPPEWRGDASLAMTAPANGDAFSVYVEVDVQHKLSDTTVHTGVAGTLPTPHPNAETSFPCTRVM
jgi:hypothetical protein